MLAEANGVRYRTDEKPVASYLVCWQMPLNLSRPRRCWASSPARNLYRTTTMNQAMMASHTMHLKDMQPCIEACTTCHATCLQTAMNHCLNTGGKHVGADHFRLMMDCAEICQTSANLQLSSSSFHVALCGICADVCEACAKSCEAIGGMEDCVKACRDCAASCRKILTKV